MSNSSHYKLSLKRLGMNSSTATTVACIAAAVSLGFSALTVSADTYRWVDDKGVVNYSERKPRGVPEDRITTIQSSNSTAPSPTPASAQPAPTPAANSSSDLSADQQEMLSRLQDAEQERQQAIAQIKQDNCDKSRKALADLTAKDRVRINMPDGSQRVLGEDERQEFISQAQNGIVRNCDS